MVLLFYEVANSEFRRKRFPGTGGSANKNVMTFYDCFDCVFLKIAERKTESGEMRLFEIGVYLRKNRRTN
jgi:hypothetical protein